MPNPSPPIPWSDDRVDQLSRLWRDGLSASQVAAALGVTRNAVIGKVHRLGLSQDGRPAAGRSPRVATAKPPAPSRQRPPRRPPRAAQACEPLQGLVARLERLEAHMCRWPIGDPRAHDFRFCGRPAGAGPYCPAHAALAFAPRPARPASRALRG